jgi:hypothetical protein
MVEQTSLEEFFEEAPAADDQELVSRRRFLTGAVAGGAVGLVAAAGTGAVVWKVADVELLAEKEAAEVELAASQERASVELARLQGLIDLYEGLEKVGLDAILETGMAAIGLPLEAVAIGSRALAKGLDWAEEAMVSLAEAVPTAQESLLWLENQVSLVASGIEKLENAVGAALDRVTDNPVGEALKTFGARVLDSLPFGLGDRFRQVLDGMVDLVTSVDELVAGINTTLLEPLRDQWFSEEESRGLGATFVDPLVEHLLDPVEEHLVNLSALANAWQDKLAEPAQEALATRAEIREEIAQYKSEHGFS